MPNSSLGICVTDLNGVITQISPENAQLIGWMPNDVVGRNLFELVPKDQLPMRQAVNRNVRRTGRPYTILSEFIGKTGASSHVDLTLTVSRGRGGRIDGIIGLWQPIEDFSQYSSEPIPQSRTSPDVADYIAAMLRELACLVGPTDDRLRAYLLSTLKQAIRADYESRIRAISVDKSLMV